MKKGSWSPSITIVTLLAVIILSSCSQLSELGGDPLVTVTAQSYSVDETVFLEFSVRYWNDDVQNLNVKIYDPDGGLAADWSQGEGILKKGESAKIKGIPRSTGKWPVDITGVIATSGERKGDTFSNETVVTVTD